MKKHLFLAFAGLIAAGSAVAQSTGIGTVTPATSAQLEVSAANKGFLPPRVALTGTTDITTIPNPVAGLTVYNTTTAKLNVWDGTKWTAPVNTAEQPLQYPTATFNYTGTMQTYTVPAGVTQITTTANGAQGGSFAFVPVYGGQGAQVIATISVTPGEVLNVFVGGAGIGVTGTIATSAGYNGGGSYNGTYGSGGGGATDIRRGGTALTNRILVAGGGGGAGYFGAGSGGAGGGLTGGSGSGGPAAGTGGTQAAGGSVGGTQGAGGNSIAQNDGAGGGGYYGGGAGGQNVGGGGGSSYVTPTGSSNITMTAGANPGNGSLTIIPSPIYAAPVLNGANFLNVPGTWSVSGSDLYYAAGNVGIGTSTPSAPLDVNGAARIRTITVPSTPVSSVTPLGYDASGNLVRGYFASGTTGVFDIGNGTGTTLSNAYNSTVVYAASASATNVTVTFNTPAANANYEINYQIGGTATTTFASPVITAKSATGFTINLTETSAFSQALTVDYTVRMR